MVIAVSKNDLIMQSYLLNFVSTNEVTSDMCMIDLTSKKVKKSK